LRIVTAPAAKSQPPDLQVFLQEIRMKDALTGRDIVSARRSAWSFTALAEKMATLFDPASGTLTKREHEGWKETNSKVIALRIK
jgi:hypothetical protein